MKKHIRSTHQKDMLLVCIKEGCGHISESYEKFKKHKKLHKGKKCKKCEYCHYKFSDFDYKLHLKVHRRNNHFICEDSTCAMKFDNLNYY